MKGLESVLKSAVVEALEEAREEAVMKPKDIQARVLIDKLKDFKDPTFRVGDVVEQDPDFMAYTHPKKGQLAIVTRLLDDPHSTVGRVQFSEENIVIAILIEGDFVEFSVDRRRFKKYGGEIA